MTKHDHELLTKIISEVNDIAKGTENVISVYRPSPTFLDFHNKDAFFRGVRGPIGSGKSVGCLAEIWFRAWDQQPDARGIRPTRFGIVRNTMPELKSTTIKTFQEFFPPEICPIKFDSPITGRIQVQGTDGTQIDCELVFIACDILKDVRKLKSLELTGIFFNEASEIKKAIVDMGLGRVGRYPSKRRVPLTWTGGWADTNSMDEDHWWYELAETDVDMAEFFDEETLKYLPADMDLSWKFYEQPPALIRQRGKYIPNPKAENVEHQQLGFGYWMAQIRGKSKEWIDAYILNQYATIFDGRRVFPDYTDLHKADDNLWPIKGAQIVLAWDFGLTPACVVMQKVPYGPLRVIREFVTDRMGFRSFIRQVVKPGLVEMKIKAKDCHGVGDPAGIASSAEAEETSSFDILVEEGLPADGATSNRFMRRLEAVNWFLNTMSGGQPGLLISPNCKRLNKGMKGGYHYRRLQVPGTDAIYKSEPEKNLYSHPCDALQYGCMYFYYEVLNIGDISGDEYQAVDNETGI